MMFALASLAIFSTIAFTTLTFALPRTSLGSRHAPPGLATLFTDLKTCLADPVAAVLQPGAAHNARVTAIHEMQACVSDAIRPVQALAGQPPTVVLAAVQDTDPVLVTAADIDEVLALIMALAALLDELSVDLVEEAADIVTDVANTLDDHSANPVAEDTENITQLVGDSLTLLNSLHANFASLLSTLPYSVPAL